MSWPLRSLLAVALLAQVGCGAGMDSRSGGDSRRSEATDVPPNEMLDDRVSAEHGDHTDWKRFELPVASSVTLAFWWDDPDVDARVVLRDQHGQALYEAVRAKTGREDRFGPVDLRAGVHFVQIEAASGSSVYTFRLETGASTGGGGSRPAF